MANPVKFKVGLTGGIASGKSMAANHFKNLGIDVIDTDIIARDLVTPSAPCFHEIIQSFGSSICNEQGELDRSKLRELVFASVEKKILLEKILHPPIIKTMRELVNKASSSYVVLVIPLLTEKNLGHEVDRILVIDCDEKIQISRLLKRDQITITLAKQMISMQASREQRNAIADDIVTNDTTIKVFEHRINSLHYKYMQFAKRVIS